MAGPTLIGDEHDDPKRRRTHLREVSEQHLAPDGIGHELRAARLGRGEDIAEIARTLRIRKDHLEAIEDSRFESLPGRTYAIGFVRSYAGYLGLDAPQCVDRFRNENAGRDDGSPLIGPPPEPPGRWVPRGWTILAVVVMGIVAYGAYHLARSVNISSAPSVTAVPARIASAGTRLALRPELRRVAAAHPPSPQSVASAPVAAYAPAAGGRLDGQPGLASAASIPPGQVLGARNRNSRVVLHVRSATRVFVEGPGGKVFIDRMLHPGDAYRVPDLVGLSLTTPDGGAVSLELDGQDMGTAGSPGHVTQALSLDPQSIVDRAGGTHSG